MFVLSPIYIAELGENDERIIPEWFNQMLAPINNRVIIKGGISALKEISTRSNASLCKNFRKYMDITPSAYVNRLRVDYAKELLIAIDYPVVEISAESGYDNLSHFYHIFKAYAGTTPKVYRGGNDEIF